MSFLLSSALLVVKIGSALIADGRTGQLHADWLANFCADIAWIKQQGIKIVVVSSGAGALGRSHLGKPTGILTLAEKQAAASIGQMALMQGWQQYLGQHGLKAAQILLTPRDTEERRRHLNARDTLFTLLAHNIIPIINENDTVATSEIRFGDNDRLAARVAQMLGADTLVLFSDIDGLYSADPKINPDATLLREITELTPAIEAMAGKPQPGYSSGGMITKLMAARIAMAGGCRMVIARGERKEPLRALTEAITPCTWFLPKDTPSTARKGWIAGHVKITGRLHIDAGATKALGQGASLLPAGLVAVDGQIERGDVVDIYGPDGRLLARGLSNYALEDIKQLLGQQSVAIYGLLGQHGPDEIIHRDNLIIF